MPQNPLTHESEGELQAAAQLYAPIARAAALGRRNGLSLSVFGALGLLISLPGWDWLGLAIGLVVATTGVVEVRTARRLAGAQTSAPLVLARNELALMAAILTYCVLKLTVLRTSGSELASKLGDGRSLGIDVEGLTDSLNTAVYASFIAVTVLYQGGLARYFLRRREMIATFERECPEWARQVVVSLRR